MIIYAEGRAVITDKEKDHGKYIMTRMIMSAKRLAGIKLVKSDMEDITRSDLNIMYVISEVPDGVPVSVISEQLGCTVPAVSKRLKPLEQGHYITRRKDGMDHRTIKVCLTDKGRETTERAKRETAEIIGRITERMGGDMDEFVSLAERFIDIAEQEVREWQSESR
ncbi:MAG: MarR family winged helix-turn-helix transcriptional regulator [Oscillospiraceae bacterium]